MSRGDIILGVLAGDYGKVRPMVIVQNDAIDGFDSIVVCPMTSDLLDVPSVRMTIEPTPENGLEARSELMVEKITAMERRRFRRRLGRLSVTQLREMDARLAFFLDLCGGAGAT